MKPKPEAKKKSAGSPLAAAQRQIISSYAKGAAGASRDASTKKQIANTGLAKLGSSLRAEDVSGKGRSAAAGRRVAGLKKSAQAASRPVRGGGSFTGDLAKFGSSLKRGKAATSPSTAKRTGLSKEVGKTSGVKRLPKTM